MRSIASSHYRSIFRVRTIEPAYQHSRVKERQENVGRGDVVKTYQNGCSFHVPMSLENRFFLTFLLFLFHFCRKASAMNGRRSQNRFEQRRKRSRLNVEEKRKISNISSEFLRACSRGSLVFSFEFTICTIQRKNV